MIKTYNYRLYPNKAQDEVLDRILWQSRNVYNAALAQRRDAWELEKRSLNYPQQWQHFRDERRSNPDTLGILNATSLQQLLRRLDKAFNRFYRSIKRGNKEVGYPRFKGRYQFKSVEYRHSDGCKLRFDEAGRALFYVQNVGEIKVKYHRPVPETAVIKHVIVKRRLGLWYVSLMLELPDIKGMPQRDAVVGIDVGLTSLLAFSDGTFLENPRWFRASQQKLRRLQRHNNRCKKGSNGQKKASFAVAKLHAHVASQRRDFWQKRTTQLVSQYGIIAIEDLSLTFMTRNKYLAKSAHDAALGTFRNLLEQKAEKAAVRVIAVNPSGTSQECCNCGTLVKKGLTVRVHSCSCGLVLDRDTNAARNILLKALGLSAGGITWLDAACVPLEAA